MKESKRYPISIERDGKTFTGEYEADARNVTTYFAGRSKSTHVNGDAFATAQMLLWEMSKDED